MMPPSLSELEQAIESLMESACSKESDFFQMRGVHLATDAVSGEAKKRNRKIRSTGATSGILETKTHSPSR